LMVLPPGHAFLFMQDDAMRAIYLLLDWIDISKLICVCKTLHNRLSSQHARNRLLYWYNKHSHVAGYLQGGRCYYNNKFSWQVNDELGTLFTKIDDSSGAWGSLFLGRDKVMLTLQEVQVMTTDAWKNCDVADPHKATAEEKDKLRFLMYKRKTHQITYNECIEPTSIMKFAGVTPLYGGSELDATSSLINKLPLTKNDRLNLKVKDTRNRMWIVYKTGRVPIYNLSDQILEMAILPTRKELTAEWCIPGGKLTAKGVLTIPALASHRVDAQCKCMLNEMIANKRCSQAVEGTVTWHALEYKGTVPGRHHGIKLNLPATVSEDEDDW
jgi:hypothetical protein